MHIVSSKHNDSFIFFYPAEVLGGNSIGYVSFNIILGDSITFINCGLKALEAELVVDAVLSVLFRHRAKKIKENQCYQETYIKTEYRVYIFKCIC